MQEPTEKFDNSEVNQNSGEECSMVEDEFKPYLFDDEVI
jgi:hypothetical protein